MGKQRYWKAMLRYGHVGIGREVSVLRFICTNSNETALDVMDLAENMPGVKNRGVVLVTEIDEVQYQAGKKREEDNLYLQQLMSYKPKIKGGNFPCA